MHNYEARRTQSQARRGRGEPVPALPDQAEVYGHWHKLVGKYAVRGCQVFDARLVAVMLVHGLTRILTFNVDDFMRFSGIEAIDPHGLRCVTDSPGSAKSVIHPSNVRWDRMTIMLIVYSHRRIPIRLTLERGCHLVDRRPEMAGTRDLVVQTRAEPDLIRGGDGGALLALR